MFGVIIWLQKNNIKPLKLFFKNKSIRKSVADAL
jgi:hypothetical protein